MNLMRQIVEQVVGKIVGQVMRQIVRHSETVEQVVRRAGDETKVSEIMRQRDIQWGR